MLDGFFGDDSGPVDVNDKRERQDRTCADEVELPPLPRKRFAGLKNQGATCYLNSFYQLCFMMPELRSLFLCTEVKFDSSWKARIFNGFKRLFLRLGYLDSQNQSTEFMNEVFGWNKSEMLNQHDIQEAMRVIFGYLEDAFRGTALEGRFSGLLKGKLGTTIKCTACGKTSERLEDFWELFMNVKSPHGHMNGNLTEALNDHFAPELMSGSNQYSCSACQQKSDAERGTHLVEIPQYLSVYVNRFEFDPVTFERKKLKADFDFPQTLSLSAYSQPAHEELYEFFAGIVHRGTAYAGHYHAIIRDMEEERQAQSKEPLYLDFNDTSVTPVDQEQLQKFKKKGEENYYLIIYRRKGPLPETPAAPFEDEVTLANRIENEQIKRQRVEYEQLQRKIRVYVADLGALAEHGIVSAEDLQTMTEDIDGAMNPRFVLDKTNPKEFLAQVQTHFGIQMADYKLYLARTRVSNSLYYVEEVNLENYDFSAKDGLGMNSQLILVNNVFADFPVFANFIARNVSSLGTGQSQPDSRRSNQHGRAHQKRQHFDSAR